MTRVAYGFVPQGGIRAGTPRTTQEAQALMAQLQSGDSTALAQTRALPVTQPRTGQNGVMPPPEYGMNYGNMATGYAPQPNTGYDPSGNVGNASPMAPGASAYWRPQELRGSVGGQSAASASPTVGQRLAAARARGFGTPGSGRGPSVYGFSASAAPLGQTPGAYFPGDSAARPAAAVQQLSAQFQQWAQANGLTKQQQQQGLAAIAAGGQPGGGGMSFGGGNGGGGSGQANALASEYQRAFDEAKAENERRYLDILGGYQNRYERNMNDLQGAGAQERRDIGEQYRNLGDNIDQGLASRGLASSTVRGTMLAGNAREQSNAMGRLESRLRDQRIAADAALSGDQLQFMERRTDEYPDYNQLAALAQGIGEAGGGGGNGISYSVSGPAVYNAQLAALANQGLPMAAALANAPPVIRFPQNGIQGGQRMNQAQQRIQALLNLIPNVISNPPA